MAVALIVPADALAILLILRSKRFAQMPGRRRGAAAWALIVGALLTAVVPLAMHATLN